MITPFILSYKGSATCHLACESANASARLIGLLLLVRRSGIGPRSVGLRMSEAPHPEAQTTQDNKGQRAWP